MNNQKVRVALSSVFASGTLALMKFAVGFLTGSVGIMSEALHSALDFGAAFITFLTVRVSDKPADQDHQYGHGKIENISALIETALLFLTSGWIIYEAIARIVHKAFAVEATWYAFVVIIVSILVDLSRSSALSKTAKETNSHALEADALHFSSDIYSSIVVLIGLIFAHFGIGIADPIAALGVSMFVLNAAWKLNKKTIDVLIDTAPDGISDRIIEIVNRIEGVMGIDKIRVKPAGSFVFAQMTISVNRNYSQEKINEIKERICEKCVREIPDLEIEVNAKPIKPDDETITERIYTLARNYDLSVHHIYFHKRDDATAIHLDLETDGEYTIERAHQIATKFEENVQAEFGQNFAVVSHIEPIRNTSFGKHNEALENNDKLSSIVIKLSESLRGVRSIKNLQFYAGAKGLVLSLDCGINKTSTLNKAHEISSQLEREIMDSVPEIVAVVVHPEPNGS